MFPVDSRRWEIERLSIMLNKSFYCQSGFSIVELMVGVTVGLLVVSTVVAIYGVVAKSGAEILGSAKLNEELRAAMDMMVGDIRRAGVWVPDNSNEREDNPNPYTIRNSTPMTDVNIADGGKCIELHMMPLIWEAARRQMTIMIFLATNTHPHRMERLLLLVGDDQLIPPVRRSPLAKIGED